MTGAKFDVTCVPRLEEGAGLGVGRRPFTACEPTDLLFAPVISLYSVPKHLSAICRWR